MEDQILRYQDFFSEAVGFASCTVCFELLHDPRNLECGHTFCSGCVPKFRDQSCPICNQVYKRATIAKNVVVAKLAALCVELQKALAIPRPRAPVPNKRRRAPAITNAPNKSQRTPCPSASPQTPRKITATPAPAEVIVPSAPVEVIVPPAPVKVVITPTPQKEVVIPTPLETSAPLETIVTPTPVLPTPLETIVTPTSVIPTPLETIVTPTPQEMIIQPISLEQAVKIAQLELLTAPNNQETLTPMETAEFFGDSDVPEDFLVSLFSTDQTPTQQDATSPDFTEPINDPRDEFSPQVYQHYTYQEYPYQEFTSQNQEFTPQNPEMYQPPETPTVSLAVASLNNPSNSFYATQEIAMGFRRNTVPGRSKKFSYCPVESPCYTCTIYVSKWMDNGGRCREKCCWQDLAVNGTGAAYEESSAQRVTPMS